MGPPRVSTIGAPASATVMARISSTQTTSAPCNWRRQCDLSLDPPARWGLWGWRVHQKYLLTWQNTVNNDSYSSCVRRHFL